MLKIGDTWKWHRRYYKIENLCLWRISKVSKFSPLESAGAQNYQILIFLISKYFKSIYYNILVVFSLQGLKATLPQCNFLRKIHVIKKNKRNISCFPISDYLGGTSLKMMFLESIFSKNVHILLFLMTVRT